MKVMISSTDIFASSILALGAFLGGYWVRGLGWAHRILPYALYFFGRTGGCSLAMSRTFDNSRMRRVERDIKERSRLIELTDNELEHWDTPRGHFWTPATMTSFFEILAEQELGIYGRGESRVRAGDVVLDCGANVGVFTAEALAAGARLVVAVEPVPRKVECLRRTFREEISSQRVILCAKGVWHEEATLPMSVFRDSVLDSFVIGDHIEDRAWRMDLPVTTIDSLVAELGLERVDFIKMDLEGADRNALRGAMMTLREHRPRMAIATEDLPDDYRVLPPLVQSAWSGYRFEPLACGRKGRFQIAPDSLYFH
jgi:FkbM family methyltransferase